MYILLSIKPTDLVEWATHDPVIVLLFYIVALSILFLVNRSGRGRGNESPFSYINSSFIYLLCVPGVLSATLWGYTISFETKALHEVNFFAYYLPIIAMVGGLFIIRQNSNIQRLPWFGALSELLMLIVVSFSFVLLMMHLQIIKFESTWLVLGMFIVVFGVLKFVWERFQRMAR